MLAVRALALCSPGWLTRLAPSPPVQVRQREATAAQMRRDASELQLQDAVTHKSVTDIRRAIAAAESNGVSVATVNKAKDKVRKMKQAEPSAREVRASSQETGQTAVMVEAEEEDRRKKEGAAEAASKKKIEKEIETTAAPPEAEVRVAEQREASGASPPLPTESAKEQTPRGLTAAHPGVPMLPGSARQARYELAAAQPGVPVLPGAARPRSAPLGIKASAADKKAGKTATSKKGAEPAAASGLDVLRRLADKEEEEEARQKAAEAVEAERVAEKARKAIAKEERTRAWQAAQAEQTAVVAKAAEIAAN